MGNRLKQTMSLIKEAKGGNTEALNEVCNRYIDRVHKIVRFRLGGKLRQKSESMDIVQDVMVKVVKDIDRFDTSSESRFINWLSKIVENTIRDNFDYYAAKKRRMSLEYSPKDRQEDENSPVNEIPDKNSPTVTQKVDEREKLLKVEEALDLLNDNQREVIILRSYVGMTFREISEVIDSSEDAVRMLFVRSMDKLTDIVADKFQL